MAEYIASIIVPTYNRSAYLPICLEAIDATQMDHSKFEIIVVDNNSTDNTRGIVQNFIQSHSGLNISYVLETKQGVSHARNRGVIKSQGEIICLLDDDSPPYPDWLNKLLEGFSDPSIGCIGGPSVLDYRSQERPPWLYGDLQGLIGGYGLLYKNPTQVSAWDQYPLSCNMAIRKRLFADLGLFRIDLDRMGSEVLAAGDTEMVSRINDAGWKVIYNPNAQVHHIVTPERLKKSHIYRISRGLATSHVILTSDRRPYMIAHWFASDSWYAFRMLVKLIIAFCMRKHLWFDDYMRYWMVAQRIPIRLEYLFNKRLFNYKDQFSRPG